jgi:hypothetical protein
VFDFEHIKRSIAESCGEEPLVIIDNLDVAGARISIDDST